MVVYQLMLSLCNSSAYFMDGSSFSFDQVGLSPGQEALPSLFQLVQTEAQSSQERGAV